MRTGSPSLIRLDAGWPKDKLLAGETTGGNTRRIDLRCFHFTYMGFVLLFCKSRSGIMPGFQQRVAMIQPRSCDAFLTEVANPHCASFSCSMRSFAPLTRSQ
jgi:hypothetical protein